MRRVVDDPLTLALARMQRETGGLTFGRGLECSMPACERDIQVGPYHDGELPDAEGREFEAHLAQCPECARRLAELRSLSGRLGPVRELSLPEMQRRRLLDMAEAVARGGVSPAAEGPAFVTNPPGHVAADEAEDKPNAMRIGPPDRADRSVRWVRWVTAAAAAIFLFSVIQLFLTRGTDSDALPGGPSIGVPTVDHPTTGPNDGRTDPSLPKQPAAKGRAAQPERENDRQEQ